MKINFSLAGIILVLLVMSNCNKDTKNENSDTQIIQDTIPVSTLTIEPQDFLVYGEYYGNIQGIKEATIICYAGGNVDKISVKEGAYVKEGTKLAHIDSERISAGYETTKLNEKIARDNHDRLLKHLEKGNSSQFQIDQAHLQWLNSKTQRIEAEKALKGALCVTPISGIVTTRHIEPYQELAPGSPAFTITQLHKVKVHIGIPESELEGVKEGNEAEISFSIYPGKTWKGKVHRITREASKMNRTFQAILHIENSKRDIKPGLTAYVKLTLVKKADQIVIPTNAILTEGKKNYVMVMKNNVANKIIIETGVTNKNQTIVTSGLEQGSALIIKGHHIISDGSLLKVLN